MKLSPTLGRPDRIITCLAGAAMVLWAAPGDLESMWLRAAIIILGVIYFAGGMGGT